MITLKVFGIKPAEGGHLSHIFDNNLNFPTLYRGVTYNVCKLHYKNPNIFPIEYYYGSLRVMPIMGSPVDFENPEPIYHIIGINNHFSPDWNMPFDMEAYPVHPKSIGICTGTKDKNGISIFTGDILTFNSKLAKIKREYVVTYSPLNGCFEGVDEQNNLSFNFCSSVVDDMEITGNWFVKNFPIIYKP